MLQIPTFANASADWEDLQSNTFFYGRLENNSLRGLVALNQANTVSEKITDLKQNKECCILKSYEKKEIIQTDKQKFNDISKQEHTKSTHIIDNELHK